MVGNLVTYSPIQTASMSCACHFEVLDSGTDLYDHVDASGGGLPWYKEDVSPVASFTKEVNPRLAKRPLVFNGRLANRGLTFLV